MCTAARTLHIQQQEYRSHVYRLCQEITNIISIKEVPSAQVLVDKFTKALLIQSHNDFVRLLDLVNKS